MVSPPHPACSESRSAGSSTARGVVTINRVLAAFRSTLTLPVSNCGVPAVGSRTSFRHAVLRVSPALKCDRDHHPQRLSQRRLQCDVAQRHSRDGPGVEKNACQRNKGENEKFGESERSVARRSLGRWVSKCRPRAPVSLLNRLPSGSSPYRASSMPPTRKAFARRDAGYGKLQLPPAASSTAFSCICSASSSNSLRHKLRTTLTIVGIVVAITAFGLLRTIVDAWYAGANASSSARLVTRNSVSRSSFRCRSTTRSGSGRCRWREPRRRGRTGSAASHITERNFFPQFAIDAPTYLDMLSRVHALRRKSRRRSSPIVRAAIVGRKLADTVRLEGRRPDPAARHDLPRHLDVQSARHLRRRGQGHRSVDDVLFHWSLLNETIKKRFPRRGDQTGVFIVQLEDPDQAAAVSAAIDADVQELAGRDADRDREGVPARLRRR